MLSVGYVLFAYASVPDTVIERFGVTYVSVGLLMSAALLSFTLVQIPGGRIVDRVSTARLLAVATVLQGVLAVGLDLAQSFSVLLVLRGLWGLMGGLIVVTGATHFARLFTGSTATRHQGAFGGMLTLGGTAAFLAAPAVVAETGWFGIHALGAAFAVPAVALFGHGLRDPATAELVAPPERNDERSTDGGAVDSNADADASDAGFFSAIPTTPTVLLASLCYVATLSGYVTLSTFITAYFDDLGVVGSLNAAVLLMATVGRTGGGLAAGEWSFDDERTVVAATLVAAAGFFALTVTSGAALLALPFVTMVAVSGPFGAIFNLAADGAASEGQALSVVIAAGNFASLLLPALTGMIREATGGYTGAFLLLGGLNALAALATVAVLRSDRSGGPE